jgi:hypothetical protein
LKHELKTVRQFRVFLRALSKHNDLFNLFILRWFCAQLTADKSDVSPTNHTALQALHKHTLLPEHRSGLTGLLYKQLAKSTQKKVPSQM